MLKILLATLLLAAPLWAAPASHEATLRALMPSEGRLLHGVFPGGYTGNEDDIAPSQVRDYERLVGKRVAWVMFSHNWFQGRAFPAETAGWIRGQGATPYIRLMLRSDTEQTHREPLFTLQAIIDGTFDADLTAWAQAAARFGTPIISEFGTEMNGDWFQWNARWNGRRQGAARFQAAYRHIIDIMRANGASNVIWVFHVNNLDGPPRDGTALSAITPATTISTGSAFRSIPPKARMRTGRWISPNPCQRLWPALRKWPLPSL